MAKFVVTLELPSFFDEDFVALIPRPSYGSALAAVLHLLASTAKSNLSNMASVSNPNT